MLRAVTLPEVGGDTIWVDAGLAYDALPDDAKQRLEGRYVTHDYRSALLSSGHDYPIVAHPVVRTHRETGRKILWVNFSQHPWIVGLDRDESRALLSVVHDQYRKPEFQVRFSWRPGSVAFWDNRAAVHYAVRNYGGFPACWSGSSSPTNRSTPTCRPPAPAGSRFRRTGGQRHAGARWRRNGISMDLQLTGKRAVVTGAAAASGSLSLRRSPARGPTSPCWPATRTGSRRRLNSWPPTRAAGAHAAR